MVIMQKVAAHQDEKLVIEGKADIKDFLGNDYADALASACSQLCRDASPELQVA